jgi:multiple sugar transport system substrate-binding protein
VTLRVRATLVCALVLASGCGRGEENGTTVQLWAMGSEGEAVARMLPAFERANPGVHVRVQQIPWSAAHEKLLTAYVGDTMPDIFQLGNTWIPELVALRAIQPLGSYLQSSTAISNGDYFAGILDTNIIDGVQYAVPWYVDTRLLFYRRDLLDGAGYVKPPATWQAWAGAARRIKEQGGGKRYAILLPFSEWEPPVIFALQLGAELLRDGDRYGNFRSAEFRRAFDFYLDFFRQGFAPSGSDAETTDPYRDFGAGFFTFYITGPWNLGEFRRRRPETLQSAWSTAPMPAPEGAGPGVSLAGGASLALFAGTRHAELAWRLIEYLSQPEQQAELNRATGDLPARMSAWQTAGLQDEPCTRAFWEQLQHVRPTPKIAEWERIAAKIGEHAEAAIRGSVPIDDALAALDADADAILAKRRSLLKKGDGATK